MASRRNQPSKRPDRRKQRTRAMLRDSLIALILEKGYDAVTVQDITDHANLSRAAFYLHYRDKDELFVASQEEMFDDLVKNLSAVTDDFLMPDGTTPGLSAFHHADQHRDLYKAMLKGQGITGITRRIREYLVDVLRERIEKRLLSAPLPIEVIAHHVTGSLLALITWWIETDAAYTAEEMAVMFHKLNISPLMANSFPKQ